MINVSQKDLEDTYKYFFIFPQKSKILLAQHLNQREDLHLYLVSLTQTSWAN